MDVHYPTLDESATPEYVLSVLGDIYRQLAPRHQPLSFETTVDDWDLVMDFNDLSISPWRTIAQGMNWFWGIECSDAEWREALLPMHKRTMADVCRLISRYAKRPRIRPIQWLGHECTSGGAFLTIRSRLHNSGVDVRDIAPSTPLAEVAHRCKMRLVSQVAQLSPGLMPQIRVSDPWGCGTAWMTLVGVIVSVFALAGEFWPLAILGAIAAVAGVVVMVLSVFGGIPQVADFGELRTFRDLAIAVAKDNAQRR